MLIVDDDPRAIKILSAFFADEPFEVVAAFGGREAIDSAKSRRPDLVVVDLMMPDVSGFEVIEWLHGRPETMDVPIVVLSAKHLTATEEELLRRNVGLVFAKTTTRRDKFLAEVKRTLAHGGPAQSPTWRQL